MNFDWDIDKAVSNKKKHGITFDEASTAFGDPMALDFGDPYHSEDEHRLLLFGITSNGLYVVISYTWRDDTIRIISAREMTRREKKIYSEG